MDGYRKPLEEQREVEGIWAGLGYEMGREIFWREGVPLSWDSLYDTCATRERELVSSEFMSARPLNALLERL